MLLKVVISLYSVKCEGRRLVRDSVQHLGILREFLFKTLHEK